jgi:hypothetical protein
MNENEVTECLHVQMNGMSGHFDGISHGMGPISAAAFMYTSAASVNLLEGLPTCPCSQVRKPMTGNIRENSLYGNAEAPSVERGKQVVCQHRPVAYI